MTLWWIGNIVLLLVIVPVVVVLLRGVLNAAKATTPAVEALGPSPRPPRRTSTRSSCSTPPRSR